VFTNVQNDTHDTDREQRWCEPRLTLTRWSRINSCFRREKSSYGSIDIDRQIDKLIYIAPIYSNESLSTSVAKQMGFDRLSKGVEGKSRPP